MDKPTLVTKNGLTVHWSTRPSMRPIIPGIIIAMVIGLGGVAWSLEIAIAFMRFTYSAMNIQWTTSEVPIIQKIVMALCVMPLAIVIFKVVQITSIIYELTDDRLLYHHGIFVRYHDEIELRRIRDFRIISPLGERLVGTGSITIISRDQTHPELIIGPIDNPSYVQDIIRRQVIEHQKATGYREIETQ